MDSEGTLSLAGNLHIMERLLEISRSLTSSAELGSFLQGVIAAASELTACETASILEPEEGGQQFHFLALPAFHRDLLQSVKVPIQASIAGRVFENGQPEVIPEVTAEARHFKGADQAANFVSHSLAAVPITFQGEKLGVLEVVNKTAQANYTEDDLTILETLASQAAIAIQNARLLNRVKKSQEQMNQLDRMKSDFIAITSHELRTPLSLILGHATFLREVLQPEHNAHIETIVRNAMRLKEIIDSLAKMDDAQSGQASLHIRPVSIRSIIEDVMTSFNQEAHEKNISLRADTGQGDLLMEGDGPKITIAISNVVENALDFTNPGGHVFLQAEQIPGFVRVSVKDDGVGIPEKDLAHVFERFYQVESHLTRSHGGMGLGLSVAKVMTEMHGGRIWVESAEGKGSNFTLLLPLTPAVQSQPPLF